MYPVVHDLFRSANYTWGTEDARGTVFWQLDLYRKLQRHYPKPKPFATEVAKRGTWKLLALRGQPVELFNVEADPSEQRNLIDRHPELVRSLAEELNQWLNEPRTAR